ncbi:MAG: acetate/propionate family kinase [Stagnimonas sp.]|nr:acetate/propionate family kinase [Stagnimonas sp.]
MTNTWPLHANILSINVGSSTVKFGVYGMPGGVALFESQFDGIDSISGALDGIHGELERAGLRRVDAVGHRIAHGGNEYTQAVLIDGDVEAAIERCIPLAPQHNPGNLAGVRMARRHWERLPQVAVFDTAFHRTIPAHASTYAVPLAWREAGLTRYGFHGTSHQHVMETVAEHLRVPPAELRIVSCHLGNGASVCAIDRGQSVDTSMGMTALEGLVMGSRCGDLDPGVYPFLMHTLGLSAPQIERALYEDSGLKALSGVSSDLRDVEAQALLGNAQAQAALQVFAHRVRKYIGAYAAAMGGCDVIAFTGGIGEHSPAMRGRICSGFEFLGLHFDEDCNATSRGHVEDVVEIHQQRSRMKVLVIRAREEWRIAKETHRLVERTRPPVDAAGAIAIPVAVSAHHVHLTQASVEALFGPGYRLTAEHDLAQPGFWAARETVDIVGPRGRIDRVRVLGPCRPSNQIEIARTEALRIGVDAPLRLSGETDGTPTVTLVGPIGSIGSNGLIVARRHVHAHPADAERMGLRDGEHFEVSIDSSSRDATFADVVLRVSEGAILEMHIDTDEANAAGIAQRGEGVVVRSPCHATVCRCAPAAHFQGIT